MTSNTSIRGHVFRYKNVDLFVENNDLDIVFGLENEYEFDMILENFGDLFGDTTYDTPYSTPNPRPTDNSICITTNVHSQHLLSLFFCILTQKQNVFCCYCFIWFIFCSFL